MKHYFLRASRVMLLALGLSFFCAVTYAQDLNSIKITINATNTTVKDILSKAEGEYGLKFFYNENELDVARKQTMSVKSISFKEFISILFNGKAEFVESEGGVIILKGKKPGNAKKYQLKGVVIDEEGLPVIGASVIEKGTKNISSTTVDGEFVLETSNPVAVLSISSMGFKDRDIQVSADKHAQIVMALDAQMLEELVVTSYGTFKKSAYAGSASNVKANSIKDIPAVSFKEMLQGNAAGVQFSAPSGQPGASSEINIRGMGSFNASNQPLYVIDGVPVRSGSINSISSDASLDVMSTINSSDIESMTVIKDAAAASLYGSRAANGVIIITTKRGKSGAPKVSLKADWGFSDFAMEYRPVMNGEQRREYIYNALKAGAIRDGESEKDAIAYADEEVEYYAPVPWCGYIDWDDVLFKRGRHQTYEASVSGGTDKFNYYSSIAYMNQEGISMNSGLERLSGRLNVDYQASDKIKLGANILFATVNQDVYSEGTSYTAPFYASRNCVVPSDAIYNEDGSWDRDFIRNSDRNPLLAATYDYQKEAVTRSFNTIYGEYEIIKDLKVRSTFSYDFNTTKGRDWSDPRTSNGDDINGGMQKVYDEYRKMVWANQISYKFNIAENHHFDALVGYEIDDLYSDYLYGYASNFATYEKQAIDNGMTLESLGGSDSRARMVSYVSRLNYDYKNKYYLGASFRADASSRLHRDNRWGNFWSVSGAWKISEEGFMANAKHWLSDLKLRMSYGVNGTLPSDYYGYMGLTGLSNGFLGQPGMLLSQIENKNLQWETNYNFNVGLDFSLFNSVNATVEYYTRTTKNLLMDSPISMTTGFSSYLMNVGEVLNKGVEFEISSVNFDTGDFKWNTSFNISHNSNEIVKLNGNQTEIISGTQIRKIGHPYRTFYVIEFAGIDPQTGKPQFYTNDVDADGNYIKEIVYDPSDANRIASSKKADPVVLGGLTNTFKYKWFDLSFLIGYQFGGNAYDIWWQKVEHGGDDLEANIPIYYLNSWKQPGDITKYEQFIESPDNPMSDYITSRSIHSTDYIRLKNITFGITIPQSWTKKIGVSNIRLYAAASNLWTWAAYDYYDPEAVRAGSAIWGTPPLKTVTFGFNINF